MPFIFPLAAVTALALYFIWSIFRRPSVKLPPGPYPLPIIGNLLQLGQLPHKNLANLSQTHGPLLSLHLGTIYTVVVSSADVARQVLTKYDQALSSRTIPSASRAHEHHKISIAFLPVGPEWRQFRKLSKEYLFSLQQLDAGEHLRRKNLQKLHDYLQACSDSGRVVNIAQAAFVTTLNLITTTLFSAELTDYGSGTAQDFKSKVEALFSVVGDPNVADFFPILQWIDPQGIKKKSDFCFGRMLALLDSLIDKRLEYRATSSPDSSKHTDFLETLLDLSQGNEFNYSPKDIAHILLEFITAGADTVATVSEWAMTELLLNPDKLMKVKQELREVMGEGDKRILRLQEADILRLPYLQAVMKEVLRYHPPGPLLIPRKSEEQVEINGYTIPKGTQILINAWAIGRDPNKWSNPDTFMPERFLGNKIDFKGQDFELIPFGGGRRLCPGLPLGNRMMHMTVATFLHSFQWKLVSDLKPGQAENAEKFGLSLRKASPLRAIPIKKD